MDSQDMQILLLQATAIENWTQFIRTATIRSGCPVTWTAYPSKALNVTWTPSSTRPSWMVDLWTLISTPRRPLMGFLRGWRPLHTAGCRARDSIRWDWWLLWRESNLTTKMSPLCLIDEHFAFSYAGFYSSVLICPMSKINVAVPPGGFIIHGKGVLHKKRGLLYHILYVCKWSTNQHFYFFSGRGRRSLTLQKVGFWTTQLMDINTWVVCVVAHRMAWHSPMSANSANWAGFLTKKWILYIFTEKKCFFFLIWIISAAFGIEYSGLLNMLYTVCLLWIMYIQFMI